MDKEAIKYAVDNGNIEWQRHALERMLERGISRATVKQALTDGKVIENYPTDRPFPSALFLGGAEGTPLHVVAAFDSRSDYCFVITVYKPDLDHFETDYKKRR